MPRKVGSVNHELARRQPRPSDSGLRDLIGRLDAELIVVELVAHAALHGDPLPVEDLDRVHLAIKRIEFIRAPLNARLR